MTIKPRTRTVRVKRIEHYKIGDFSFVEYDHEVIEESVPVEESTSVAKEIRAQVNGHIKTARDSIKKAFEEGEFEL